MTAPSSSDVHECRHRLNEHVSRKSRRKTSGWNLRLLSNIELRRTGIAMSNLTNLNPVRVARRGFDRLGREAFLLKCGLGQSTGYFLEIDGEHRDFPADCGATVES